jgi:adenylate cyclase
VELIDRVLARSPDNFMVLSIRAAGSLVDVNCGWREVSTEDASTCRRLAQRAIELNERSDFAHMIFGTYALYCERDARSAMRQARRCLELNPSYILGLDLLGAALIFSGKAEEGLSHCIKAAETNARFPANAWLMQSVSCGHFTLGRYHDAIEWAQRADEREPGVPRPLLLLASAAWHAGDLGLARKASAQLLECTPEFRLDEMRRWPFQGNDDWERFRRGVAESGLA